MTQDEAGGKKPVTKKKGGRGWVSVLIVVLLLLILAGGGYGYLQFMLNSPLPKVDGELKAKGLFDRVEIYRDGYGIPHIYAKNVHDMLFAQGYVQAQDRWWQMEFFRKTCGGRIEELTGKKAGLVSADIFLRTMGWYKVAEKEYSSYSLVDRARLDAFAGGVNAYLAGKSPSDLSVNYTVLGLTGVKYKIEPWSPLDTLAFGKLMAWDLSYSDDDEILRSKLYSGMDRNMADIFLTPSWPYGEKPTVMQPEDVLQMQEAAAATGKAQVSQKTSDAGIVHRYDDFIPAFGFLREEMAHGSSNNWVAGPSMTKTRKPLLANDPHLGLQMPSIWYEVGLHCADDGSGRPFDCVGFAFAPCPGIIIGHNNDIAWAVTNLYFDVADHYQMKINPDNSLQYEWNGSWRDMKVRDETISFGDGAAPMVIRVRETHLGPIINDNKFDEETGQFHGFNNKEPLSLRWTALEPANLVLAVNGLNTARNWDEFRSALKYWDIPSQNVIYADTSGNIGYQAPGKVPLRALNHSGLLPVPGWTDEYEWKGYLPFDLLPRIYNPARGYIASANQQPVPREYDEFVRNQLGTDGNYRLGYNYNLGYRGLRVNQLLKELAPHSMETFQKMQGDNVLLSVKEVFPYLAGLKLEGQELVEIRDWLFKWDQSFDEDSSQAAFYSEFWMKLVNNVFSNKLVGINKPVGDHKEMWAIELLLKDPANKWWDDPATKDIIETRDDTLLQSFKEGYTVARAAMGTDRSLWKWGMLHTATPVSNPLGASGIGLLEGMVNRGPYPIGGTTDAVNAMRWTADTGNFKVRSNPSMRMIIDLSDFSKSVSVNATGSSGHPASKQYDDQIQMWRTVTYHPMLWTRQQVQDAAAHKLALIP